MKTDLKQSDFLNADDVRKSQSDRILSCYKETDRGFADDISKAEESKKAKVIGQTKSEKPIYSDANYEAHKDFDSKDHKDAVRLHKSESVNAAKAAKAMVPGATKDKMLERAANHAKQAIEHESCATKVGEIETTKADEFKHNRLMAGYHAAKGKELKSEAADLHSSSNTELHVQAKEKEGEASRHAKMETFHAEKAKSLHSPEAHGEWNKTIPTWDDAMAYGKHYAKSVDKSNPTKEDEEDSTENVIIKQKEQKKNEKEGSTSQEKKILSKSEAFDMLGVEIEKSEGSRGGKIIGHTKSGKPVYAGKSASHADYKHFTKEDHKDAAEHHDNETPAQAFGNDVEIIAKKKLHGSLKKEHDLKAKIKQREEDGVSGRRF